MTESPENYRAHLGYVLFPRSADDLTNTTRCPACFSPLSTMVCHSCGLNLDNPTAIELAEASAEAADALDRRLDLIGQLRFESSASAQPTAATIQSDHAPVGAAARTPDAQIPQPRAEAVPTLPPRASAPVQSAPAIPTPPRRQISVQVVLLLVGVALLSIGAIFFLVYAFINFGLVWRSLIIATVTVAAFVGATLLNRRRLTATAESVAVLAVILSYLDAFALRANDLLVVGDSNGFLHWGVTLLVTSVGFIVWNRFSTLRVASIVGFATIGPGLSLVVLGLTESVRSSFPAYLALLALALGCLAHPLAGRISRPVGPAVAERYTLMITAVLGLIAAGFAALSISPGTPFAPAIGLVVVGVAAAAHADLAFRTRTPLAFSTGFAVIGSVAVATSFLFAGHISDNSTYSLLVPPLGAALFALVLEHLHRRRIAEALASPLLGAAIAAAVVAALSALPALGRAFFSVLDALGLGSGVWSVPGSIEITRTSPVVIAVVALAALVALVALSWTVQGILRDRLPLVLWAAIAVLLLAVPLAAQLWLIVLLWTLLSVAGAAMLVASGSRGVGVRLPIAVGAATALALGYGLSWSSADTWLVGSVGALVTLVIARFSVANTLRRSALLGLATVAGLITAGAGGWRIQQIAESATSAAVFATLAVAAVAVLVVVASAVASRILSDAERRTLFWIALTTALFSMGSLWITATVTGPTLVGGLVVPGNLSFVIASAAAVGALLVWMLSSVTESFPVERLTSSAVLAPALAWFAVSLALSLATVPPAGALAVFAIVSAALVAACALGIARFTPGLGLRGAVDWGVSAVLVSAVIVSVVSLSPLTWIVLVLAALGVLVLAVAPDGLFASTSTRRYLGWVALALGVAGLFWLLTDEQVQDAAAYVLPPAGALLLISAAAWSSARRRAMPSTAAPWIALAGLLLAIVPLGLVHSAEMTVWLVILAAVSSVLLLAGTLGRTAPASRPFLDVAAIAGGLGLLSSAYGHSFVLAQTGTRATELVLWLAATFGVFVLASFGLAGQARALPPRLIASQVLLGIPMLLTFVLGLIGLGNSSASELGGVSLVVVFAAIHVLGSVLDRAPFTRIIGWAAIGLAGASWLIASSLGSLQPLEWATVPIGLALLVTGSVQLRRLPEARSWQWLTPGILVGIAPSLLASFVDEPIWRLVGVGVACVIAIVAGALLRLQAPLVLGSALVLVHGLRTFAPQIVAVYQLTEWWVWAVVGGAIIFFIGFTFEKRKRDFQNTTTKIASLR